MSVDQVKAIMRAKDAISSAKVRGTQAVIGFDGFVDEISEAVDKRTSPDTYKRIETIAEFGERIGKAAGLSTNIELVPKVIKLGGNGPIMANVSRFRTGRLIYRCAWPTLASRFQRVGSQGPSHLHCSTGTHGCLGVQ